MVADNENLHRLIWSPDDFEDGQIKTSAFRRSDLLGDGGYVSVSRTSMMTMEAEIKIAEKQSANADGVAFVREDAWSALLNCGTVRSITDVEGTMPFNVSPEPIAGENEAHAGISNVSGKKGKGYVNQLRVLLVEHVYKTHRC